MPTIDSRLLDCPASPESNENFSRIMAEIDRLKAATVCQVAFDSDGGSAAATQYVPYGEKAVEPSTPTKTGNTFDGWYDGAAAYNFAAKVMKNTTLTAHWTAN